MFVSVIVTVLIAAAVIGLFCIKAVRLEKCRKGQKSYVIVPCFEYTKGFELFVKGLYWDEVFSSAACPRKIILVTGSDIRAAETADRLAEKLSIVKAVNVNELTDHLKKEGGV